MNRINKETVTQDSTDQERKAGEHNQTQHKV